MLSEGTGPTVILIDARELRRAAVASLLSEWAHTSCVNLLALTPTDALQLHDRMSDCRMVILAVGSTPITELDAIQSIDVVHGLVPDAPIVILSDRDESAEVVAALEAGVQGFIPSTMTPELVLQTLSFIMSGGT
ncbi:MAG TPA: hypothetical protein VE665_06840, partial [Hyphomicrobiaceae bacterium]|nr:hypothetical protein [Hyphomicrobiaceae bacterium]